MSKYIRTKDGIYELKENGLEQTPKEIQIALMNKDYKTSDTIEELCDGFYNDILNDFDCFGFDGLYIYNNFESFKEDWKGYRTYDNWQGNGYGFIKTDKGLIYVAKMDNDGKLVLI